MEYTLEVIAGHRFWLDDPRASLASRAWSRLKGTTEFLYEGVRDYMIIFKHFGIMQSPLLFPLDSEKIALPDVPGIVKVVRVDENKIQLTYTTP